MAAAGSGTSWQVWVVVIQAGLLGASTIIGALLLHGFKVGRWAQAIDHTEEIKTLRASMLVEFAQADRRFNTGSEKMSDLASKVQAMIVTQAEERVRHAVAEQHRAEVRAELDRMWKILDQRGHPRGGG